MITVHYSRRRGGPKLAQAAAYIRQVYGVCATHMKFRPTCIALCVHGDDMGDPKAYGRRISVA